MKTDTELLEELITKVLHMEDVAGLVAGDCYRAETTFSNDLTIRASSVLRQQDAKERLERAQKEFEEARLNLEAVTGKTK